MIDGHLGKHDFSRWIAGVFKDNPLAAQVRQLEDQYVINRVPDINDAIIQVIQDRYQIVTKK
jgi:hypothetical protein